MNPPGVEALAAVEEDGARGSGVVRGDSEGLFKGLAVGRPFSGAVGSRRTANSVNRPSGAGCFLTLCECRSSLNNGGS